jgi:hypothetical protein
MSALPQKLLVPCAMKRVICHWSEGNYKANSTDLEHYHILIEGDGTVRGGDHSIADNVSTRDGDYAAHTRGANTGAIGVACCCMVGCKEKPFKPGAQPLKETQWKVMVQVVAELCQFYKIPVTPETVLGHGEVQGTLGIKQLGEDPWAKAAKDLPPGTKSTGKITKVVDFGAFVELAPGVEGMIHVSELADEANAKAGQYIKMFAQKDQTIYDE